MFKDRRTSEDRRSVRRYIVNIDIEWEGQIGKQKGTVSDISSLGCFVLCSGEVENGETVKLFLPIGDGKKLQYWGKVINHVFEIGFGVEFVEMNKTQKEFLEKWIRSLN